MNASRRQFIAGTFAAGAALPLASCAQAAAADTFAEPPKGLKVAGEYDLIVAGGGPAGFAAAVTAARMGRKVMLFEAHGALGGIWTTGLLGCIIDFGRADLSREIIRHLDRFGARQPRRKTMLDSNFTYEPEAMKVVLEGLATSSGVNFRYHSPVVAAYRDASGRNVETVVTESKSGRQAWRAKIFMDCTGDGDLAAFAGCGYDEGGLKPGSPAQPASLVAVVTVADDSRIRKFTINDPDGFDAEGVPLGEPKKLFYDELVAAGFEPSYARPTLFRIHKNLFALMANQEYDVKVDDCAGITAATVRARREIFEIVAALTKKDPKTWEGLRIVATAEQLGHRTARRIHGRYTMTGDDVHEGRRFPDAVASSSFGVDIHAVTRQENREKPTYSTFAAKEELDPYQEMPLYQIPLRACRAKDADNLYMAGRCISGEFAPQASYRVTGPAVEMAEGVVRRLFSRASG